MGNIEKVCPKCQKRFYVKPSLDRVVCCSRSCANKMRKASDKQREIARKTMTGNKYKLGLTPWNKGIKWDFMVNEKNVNWKGDSVSYGALHAWVRRNKGKVSECVYCGSGDKLDWASISHKAKRDLDDYIPLCRDCHKKYDMKGGHQFGYQ